MAAEVICRADAQARGLKRYFTGLECKHGHIAERTTANGCCTVCSKAIDKRWTAANRNKVLAKWQRQAARHRVENPERIRRNQKKWEQRNPAQRREIQNNCRAKKPEVYRGHEKKWRDANPEKVSKKNKAYKVQHADRLRPIALERVNQWRKENPEKVRTNSQRRRARKHGASGSHTAAQTTALLAKQNFKCASCGTSILTKRHLDHVVPLSRGGSNDIANLQWLCPSCNCSKHDKDPIAWAQENGRLL